MFCSCVFVIFFGKGRKVQWILKQPGKKSCQQLVNFPSASLSMNLFLKLQKVLFLLVRSCISTQLTLILQVFTTLDVYTNLSCQVAGFVLSCFEFNFTTQLIGCILRNLKKMHFFK